MIENNKDRQNVSALLKDLCIEFTDRVNDVAELYDVSFIRCMIVEVAALTQPIIYAGLEEDLNKMIHMGGNNE